jgi:hypothetical protein
VSDRWTTEGLRHPHQSGTGTLLFCQKKAKMPKVSPHYS